MTITAPAKPDTAEVEKTLTPRQREVLGMLRKRGNVGIEPAGRGHRSVAAHNMEPEYHVARVTLQKLVDAGLATWHSYWPTAAPTGKHFTIAVGYEEHNPYGL
ncbi:hypothetical protein ACFVAJ_17425 [Agromyces sp. NPDC057679]|uniref:hypothetical protein n=1 Tax=Agromyces sp. NPDC057679 TaxID=3346207 RepID=UPI00367176EE